MKICVYILTGSFFVGGGEIVPLMQAKYLHKLGHDVTVVTLKVNEETSYFKSFKENNASITFENLKATFYHHNATPFEQRKVDHELGHELYFNLARSFSEYCSKNNFDTIITHYAPAAISIPKNSKQILFLHGIPDSYQTINKVCLDVTDGLVAVSKSVSDGWKEIYGINDIKVLYNGVEEHVFHNKNVFKDIDIFYVGRLIEIKGVQFLIEAIEKLKDRSDLKVVIGGKGPYEQNLKDMVEKKQLINRIKFIGYIPDNELIDYYNRSKIIVLPSYAKEGVLTTLLEASACEACVISSNCCGMKEFIINNKSGFLVEPKNSDEIAEKVKMLINNEKLRNEVGKNARMEIENNWTWTKSAQKLESFIKNVTIK